MGQYKIYVSQEVYGELTIEAESPKDVAKFMETFSPNTPQYDRIKWTPQPDDFRVLDTFDDMESGEEYNSKLVTFDYGTALCPYCGRKLKSIKEPDRKLHRYHCEECDAYFFPFQANYTLNYKED